MSRRRLSCLFTAALAAVVLPLGAAAPVPAAAASASAVSRPPVAFGLDIPGDDLGLYDAAVADAGRAPTLYSVFVKLDSTSFTVAKLQGLAARGLTPFITVEPWSWKDTWGQTGLAQYALDTVARGDWDTDLRRIAGVVQAYGGPVYVRFAHEMNGWWYPWAADQNGNTPASYVKAWRHVVTLFRTAAPGRTTFVWSPNAVTGSPKESPLEQSYPGNAWVDAVGMTAYGHGASAGDTFDRTYARLTALTNRPVILSETGADGAQKSQWLSSFGPWIAAHRKVTAFVWFNTTPATGASGDYRFNVTSSLAADFRSGLTGLRFRSH